eukprot:PhM_4_TR8725/c0_g2_i1/m.83461
MSTETDGLDITDKNALLFSRAVQNFLALQLSYFFTATLVDGETSNPTFRFQFSRPTQTEPVPSVTVAANVQLLREEGTRSDYVVVVEGQRYTRLVSIDPKAVTGKELNEELIRKVYEQKAALRQRHLWVDM